MELSLSLSPLYPITHSEGALCAFAGTLRQSSSTHAGRDPTSHPGAPVTVGPHHGLHRVASDTHGSLEEGGRRGNRRMSGRGRGGAQREGKEADG